MLVAQNSLGPVCPVPLTVRGTSRVLQAATHPWTREIHPRGSSTGRASLEEPGNAWPCSCRALSEFATSGVT